MIAPTCTQDTADSIPQTYAVQTVQAHPPSAVVSAAIPGPPAVLSCLSPDCQCTAVMGLTGKPSSASSIAGCNTCVQTSRRFQRLWRWLLRMLHGMCC